MADTVALRALLGRCRTRLAGGGEVAVARESVALDRHDRSSIAWRSPRGRPQPPYPAG